MKCYFKFEITQTTSVLLYKIEQGVNKRWRIEGDLKDNEFRLWALDDFQKFIDVQVGDGVLVFETVNGYLYEVVDGEKDGAKVTFEGPVNALLAQSLMPRMTYVHETRVGKYEDMDEYVEIQEFMKIREERHNGEPNPQDKYGWRINMKFDNELCPWLPKFWGMRSEKPQKKSKKFKRG